MTVCAYQWSFTVCPSWRRFICGQQVGLVLTRTINIKTFPDYPTICAVFLLPALHGTPSLQYVWVYFCDIIIFDPCIEGLYVSTTREGEGGKLVTDGGNTNYCSETVSLKIGVIRRQRGSKMFCNMFGCISLT